jgi:hypothetical protein
LSVDQYRRAVRGAVALGVDSKLTGGALVEALVDNVAWIIVGVSPDRKTVEDLIEIARHQLDLAVARALVEMENAKDRSGGSSQRGSAAPDNPG